MKYADGFLIPILKKNIPAYRRMALIGAKVWRECGALEYRECIGDDLNVTMGISFPKTVKLKPGETVVFSWIVYKSLVHRNRVVKKVMSDKRLVNMMEGKSMPFDVKRMAYGGFKIIVEMFK